MSSGKERAATPSVERDAGVVLSVIKRRRSGRVPYDRQRPPSPGDLAMIMEAARWAPTAHNMQNFELVVLDDPVLLAACESVESTISQTFLEENYRQMSFSESELRRKKTGVLATEFPPSWRDPAEIRSGRAARQARTKLGDAMQLAPLVLVTLYDRTLRAPASEGDVLGKISLGCVLENIWLMATALGISCQVVSRFSDEQVERNVLRLIDAPRDMRIAFACRLGYPQRESGSSLRVRRDIEEFAHDNRYALPWRR